MGMVAPRKLILLFAIVIFLASVLTVLAVPTSRGADNGGSPAQSGRIVDTDPAGFTPHVMDGAVYSMTRVGDTIVVGGDFTTVRNAGSSVNIPRRNLFAFNAVTGQVNAAFAPNPNGTVYALQPGPDDISVYVGGSFTSATSGGGTVSVSRLFKASLITGDRVTTFQPGTINGQVRDLSVVGDRLWVAGKFTHLQGQPSRALGTLNATTGARDPYYTAEIAGVHNGGVTNVLKIATDPSGTKLVAVGNFDTVNGVKRHQFAVLDISGASMTLADYYTTQYESACSSAFETYLTDVNFSPDGSFFVVSTTGAFGGTAASMAGTSGCDLVARYESNASGTNVRPTWTSYTGGDTTWTVEVTDDVVYAGGHQRWQNNPTRGDAAGQGAVSRPGIAALDTANGMPYSWNPTRTLGAGVRDMVATPDGLFVGSDTDQIGGETHRKVAFFPLGSGKKLSRPADATFPGVIYRVATGSSQLLRRDFDGAQVTAATNGPNGTGWGTAVGAFMIDGDLYTAYSNRTLTRRTFDGTTYGPETAVTTADQLVYQSDWHNSDVPSLTSLFYRHGWLYYTKSGSSQLFRRGFEPESGIVGQQVFSTPSVTGVSYSTVRGAFVADGQLWFASTNGTLNRADWGTHGAVSGTAQTVSSAGTGWSSRSMFLYQGAPVPPPVNQPPTAAFDVTCTGLDCSFDAGASTDPDGTIAGYSWDFGDGGTDTAGPTTTHTYAAGGAVNVSLTVTDSGGTTATTSRTAQPSTGVAGIAEVATSTSTGNRMNHRTPIPDDVQPGDLLLAAFVANTTSPTYTAPPGWTELETTSAGTKAVGRLYSRVATAADAGGNVTVTSSGYAKSTFTVAVYRGASLTDPVTDSAATVQTSSGAVHVTPTLIAPDNAHWLVSFWGDKSSDTSAWTLPPDVTQRSLDAGTGSGHTSAVLGDSAGPVPAGPVGGLSATADDSGTAAITFSVLIAP